jgi:hypothetical protein
VSGCRGVVHLWSLDVAHPEETTVASLDDAQTLGCGSAMLLVQELAETESPDLPRLWLITRALARKVPVVRGSQCFGDWVASLRRNIRRSWAGWWIRTRARRDAALVGCARKSALMERTGFLVKGGDMWPFDPPAQVGHARSSRAGGRQLSDQRRLATLACWLRVDGRQGARRLILLGRTRLPPRLNWIRGRNWYCPAIAAPGMEALGACDLASWSGGSRTVERLSGRVSP